jgi:beta-glucosidase
MKKNILLIAAEVIFIVLFLGTKKYNNVVPYRDPNLPVENRVEDLLNRMTLQEKINLLGGTGFATKPNERLGIPELKMTDGPVGVRWNKSTAFPSGISMASTWDTALIYKVGAAIGEEVKGKGRDVILGPCVNILRIPQGGRDFESYGEDPYLASRMAVSYIRGVQSEGVAATVKHFACNNQEYQRGFVNVKIDERGLNEIYLPAFKAAVEEGNVLCVMSAYNKVNGTYCSENDYLLKTKLKNDWDFKGLVMSDWGAVHSSIPTAKGGLDLEMPYGDFLNDSTLLENVKNGIVDEKIINDKVRRILSVMFKLGLFENQHEEDAQLINSSEHQQIALKAAQEGIVLLKNENNILPLNLTNIRSIAVIGPDAAEAKTGGGGSSQVNPVFSVSPLEALKHKIGDKIKINYADGVKLLEDSDPIPSSVLFYGNEHGLKGEYFNNKNLQGTPVFTRIDPEINFNWSDNPPRQGFNKDNYSVRWTGILKPQKSGEYNIDLLSDDGVRLYINDKLIISNWTDHGTVTDSYRLNLQAGKPYKIKLEYYQSSGGAVVKLARRLPNKNLISEAVNTAKESDVVIIFAGSSNVYESEGFDRNDLYLPGNQDSLIEAVAKIHKHVIVVLTTGSPYVINKWAGKVDGIVESWFAGEEIGNAVADVLLGNVNPSGKLPVTFPKKWEDCSAFNSYKTQDSVTDYSDGIFVGYRHFDKNNINPQFPFGCGLSYTSFDYENLKIEKLPGDTAKWKITFQLTNSGRLKGTEIPQLYIKDVESSLPRPEKELKGFDRVSLNPGETKNVVLIISKDQLAFYDPGRHEWRAEPGEFEAEIGSSSRDIRLHDKFTLE